MRKRTIVVATASIAAAVAALAAPPAHAEHRARCGTGAGVVGMTACWIGDRSAPLAAVEGVGDVMGVPGLVAVDVKVYEFDMETFTAGDLLVSCHDEETLADVLQGTAEGRAACAGSAPWEGIGTFYCELSARGSDGAAACNLVYAH